MDLLSYNRILYSRYLRFMNDDEVELYENAIDYIHNSIVLGRAGYIRMITTKEAEDKLANLRYTIKPFINKTVADFTNDKPYPVDFAEKAECNVRCIAKKLNRLDSVLSVSRAGYARKNYRLSLVVDLGPSNIQVTLPGFVEKFNIMEDVKDAEWVNRFSIAVQHLIEKRFKVLLVEYPGANRVNIYDQDNLVLIRSFESKKGKSIPALTERQYHNLVRDLEKLRDVIYEGIRNRAL